MQTFKIGELARHIGVGIETIRYYERRGLLPQPDRGPSGYRQFGPLHVRHLRLIRSAKELGFTLREIGSLLPLLDSPTNGCEDLHSIARQKLREIDEKMKELETFKTHLCEAIAICESAPMEADCRALRIAIEVSDDEDRGAAP